MIIPLVILFLLGIAQGAIGWIMVKSGLVPEKMFVGHIQLATHFMAALLLLCYTWWFALSISITSDMKTINRPLNKLTSFVIFLLFFQLIYGAFMAGLHAATAAPTWPTINGQWFPDVMNNLSPRWKNFIDNKITIQFIHRGLAYTVLIAVLFWWSRARKESGTNFFKKVRSLPLILVFLQVVLGIATVTLSPFGNNLVWFGVAHQMVAILFLMSLVLMLFIVRPSEKQKRYF